MKFRHLFSYLISLTSLNTFIPKNILLTNDDSWVSTNIRATYNSLRNQGHNVILVAPATDQSGQGGRFVYPSSPTLERDDIYGILKAGDPSWGHDKGDKNIWYFNGTTAACVAFAFDYVFPLYFQEIEIDLVISGPNKGNNIGPMSLTSSGTIAGAYNGIARNVPAISFSGSNKPPNASSSYLDGLSNDPNLSANIYARKVVELTNHIFRLFDNGKKMLHPGVGLNVNFPKVSEVSDIGCMDPPFVYTRFNGPGSRYKKLVYNATTGIFDKQFGSSSALDQVFHGIKGIPDESSIINNKTNCKSAITAFAIDFTAPLEISRSIRDSLSDIIMNYDDDLITDNNPTTCTDNDLITDQQHLSWKGGIDESFSIYDI